MTVEWSLICNNILCRPNNGLPTKFNGGLLQNINDPDEFKFASQQTMDELVREGTLEIPHEILMDLVRVEESDENLENIKVSELGNKITMIPDYSNHETIFMPVDKAATVSIQHPGYKEFKNLIHNEYGIKQETITELIFHAATIQVQKIVEAKLNNLDDHIDRVLRQIIIKELEPRSLHLSLGSDIRLQMSKKISEIIADNFKIDVSYMKKPEPQEIDFVVATGQPSHVENHPGIACDTYRHSKV